MIGADRARLTVFEIAGERLDRLEVEGELVLESGQFFAVLAVSTVDVGRMLNNNNNNNNNNKIH